jgi:type II secretory ATPase GspE/PulE/Tfp pilus assembly ATPase PilB-like protein
MGVKNAFLGRLLASSDKFSDEQVAQTINLLVEHGVKHGASDIHLEPHERFVQVRYRIDNTLKAMHKLPLGALPAISAQIKDQAGLNAANDHLPQEGQYATLVGEEQFQIQVTTMPVIGGEKIVMHISSRLSKPLTLEQLGFWGPSLTLIQGVLARSHGLIVTATPRRNGRTTTMHSMLQMVTTPSVSVATVEKTIEFRVPGISQTQVRPQNGVTFYDAFSAALNQDPNVILLSDLTDKATGDLVVQAASGGHLVFLGMNANNAGLALAQLRTMTNEEPFLFAHAVRAAVSQRLVRKLCPRCRHAVRPSREEIHEIQKAFGITTAAHLEKVHNLDKLAVAEGLGGSNLNTTSTGITGLWKAHDEGCEACNFTGYQGAIALTEAMESGDRGPNLQAALLAGGQPDKIRRAALKDDFVSMELDGLIKVLRGQTTITEVLRTLAL